MEDNVIKIIKFCRTYWQLNGFLFTSKQTQKRIAFMSFLFYLKISIQTTHLQISSDTSIHQKQSMIQRFGYPLLSIILIYEPKTLIIFYTLMNQYFSANTQHLDDRFLLAAAPQLPRILTYGDTILKNVDPITGHEQEYTLNDIEYSAITLSPDATHCLLSNNSSLFRFDFNNKTKTTQGQNIVNGAITALSYSSRGRFVAIGSEEGKPVIYEPSTGKKYKCRPGHISKVVNLFISNNEQYLCSIGQDKNALIYQLSNEQPREVAKYFITKLSDCNRLKGSFHPSKMMVFLPGEKYLQKLELIQQRWQLIKMEKMKHLNSEIELTQTPKNNTVVTSSREEVCIWNIKTQEKLFEIEQFHLVQTVSIMDTFFGTRDDGQLYRYKREIKEEQPMDIEQNEHSQKIEFQNAEDEEEKQQDNDEQDRRRQIEFKMQKKSKADKIITCMPQSPLTSATRLQDGQRFLFVNSYGCVIQRQEAQQSIIQLQFGHQDNPKKIIIARNRPLQYFDINPFALVYASQNQFGLKVDHDAELQSWEVTWSGIRAITIGVNWIAVASQDQIKIFDMFGHQTRSIAFDRDLIALRSHQNMLAAVYHQSIPMFGSQQLAMQLYLIDLKRAPLALLSSIHVPLNRGALLSYFDFSLQGMIVSQDTLGNLKVFSLQRNDWSSVSITGIDDTRKAWIIGCKDYQLIYWKTSQTGDEPTVAPRFVQKYGLFTIPTIGNYPQGAQQMYETFLWNRFSLDHEKARNRLWGRFKKTRQINHRYFYLVDSILSQKDIVKKNNQLDDKYHSLVQLYLKSENASKALYLCITCIRSIEVLKKMADLFDDYNKRPLGIKLQDYCQEKENEIKYQQMQQFQLKKLKDEAETTIKPRSEDPMRRPAQKKITQSLPSLSQNFSQESMEINNILNESNVSGNTHQVNPFLKRKGTQESLQAKKKQITQHVQKFGIKKKVEQRTLSRKL